MTKAEKALTIERVGAMVWGGAMEMKPAVWFVAGLYDVELPEAEDMIHDAMAKWMLYELEMNLKQIGEKHV